jgi:hypothetical protein
LSASAASSFGAGDDEKEGNSEVGNWLPLKSLE